MFVRFIASNKSNVPINLFVDEIGSILEAPKSDGGVCAEIYVRENAAPNPYLHLRGDARFYLCFENMNELLARWNSARTELETARSAASRPVHKSGMTNAPGPGGTA